MKKILYITILLVLINCSDIKTPKEKELKQYPWIEVFTPGRLDFIGIEHDLDLGTYSFSFKSRYSQIRTFFEMTDSSAVSDKWEIVLKHANTRIYKKKSTVYASAQGFDIVSLTFNPDDGRITFTSSLNK